MFYTLFSKTNVWVLPNSYIGANSSQHPFETVFDTLLEFAPEQQSQKNPPKQKFFSLQIPQTPFSCISTPYHVRFDVLLYSTSYQSIKNNETNDEIPNKKPVNDIILFNFTTQNPFNPHLTCPKPILATNTHHKSSTSSFIKSNNNTNEDSSIQTQSRHSAPDLPAKTHIPSHNKSNKKKLKMKLDETNNFVQIQFDSNDDKVVHPSKLGRPGSFVGGSSGSSLPSSGSSRLFSKLKGAANRKSRTVSRPLPVIPLEDSSSSNNSNGELLGNSASFDKFNAAPLPIVPYPNPTKNHISSSSGTSSDSSDSSILMNQNRKVISVSMGLNSPYSTNQDPVSLASPVSYQDLDEFSISLSQVAHIHFTLPPTVASPTLNSIYDMFDFGSTSNSIAPDFMKIPTMSYNLFEDQTQESTPSLPAIEHNPDIVLLMVYFKLENNFWGPRCVIPLVQQKPFPHEKNWKDPTASTIYNWIYKFLKCCNRVAEFNFVNPDNLDPHLALYRNLYSISSCDSLKRKKSFEVLVDPSPFNSSIVPEMCFRQLSIPYSRKDGQNPLHSLKEHTYDGTPPSSVPPRSTPLATSTTLQTSESPQNTSKASQESVSSKKSILSQPFHQQPIQSLFDESISLFVNKLSEWASNSIDDIIQEFTPPMIEKPKKRDSVVPLQSIEKRADPEMLKLFAEFRCALMCQKNAAQFIKSPLFALKTRNPFFQSKLDFDSFLENGYLKFKQSPIPFPYPYRTPNLPLTLEEFEGKYCPKGDQEEINTSESPNDIDSSTNSESFETPSQSPTPYKNSLKGSINQNQQAEIRFRIFHSGIDPQLRTRIYPLLLDYLPWDASHQERYKIRTQKRTDYQRLKSQWKSLLPSQVHRNSKFKEAYRIITKDVVRTDRDLPQFKDSNSKYLRAMRNILLTWITYNPDLSYVQGMSDLLSPILLIMNGDEADSFWCFVGLFEYYGLWHHFRVDQKGIDTKLTHIKLLVKILFPNLFNYLHKIGSLDFYFCFRWILVLFKREFPMNHLLKLWDVLLCQHLFEIRQRSKPLPNQIISQNSFDWDRSIGEGNVFVDHSYPKKVDIQKIFDPESIIFTTPHHAYQLSLCLAVIFLYSQDFLSRPELVTSDALIMYMNSLNSPTRQPPRMDAEQILLCAEYIYYFTCALAYQCVQSSE